MGAGQFWLMHLVLKEDYSLYHDISNNNNDDNNDDNNN